MVIRTVIKQRNSFTITLPKKWAETHTLKNKDNVSITFDNFSNALIISPLLTKNEKPPETSINAADQSKRNTVIAINQAYRLGYDKIKMINLAKDHTQAIEKHVKRNLLGFSFSKDDQVIEALSFDKYDEDQTNSIARKIFHIINQSFTISLDELDFLKEEFDFQSNYLRRIIVKNNHQGKKAYTHIALFNKLALLQHAILRARKKADEKTKLLHEEIKNLFVLLEKGFWKKEIELLLEIDEKQKTITTLIDNFTRKEADPVVQYLYEEVRMIQISAVGAIGILAVKKEDSI